MASHRGALKVPKYNEFYWPVIRALKETGGSASIAEMSFVQFLSSFHYSLSRHFWTHWDKQGHASRLYYPAFSIC